MYDKYIIHIHLIDKYVPFITEVSKDDIFV